MPLRLRRRPVRADRARALQRRPREVRERQDNALDWICDHRLGWPGAVVLGVDARALALLGAVRRDKEPVRPLAAHCRPAHRHSAAERLRRGLPAPQVRVRRAVALPGAAHEDVRDARHRAADAVALLGLGALRGAAAVASVGASQPHAALVRGEDRPGEACRALGDARGPRGHRRGAIARVVRPRPGSRDVAARAQAEAVQLPLLRRDGRPRVPPQLARLLRQPVLGPRRVPVRLLPVPARLVGRGLLDPACAARAAALRVDTLGRRVDTLRRR